MPLLNYRTRVAPAQSISEIQQLLARKGASHVTTGYDGRGEPVSIDFMYKVGGMPVKFRMPLSFAGVQKALAQQSGRSRVSEKTLKERAVWVAWRILKDWIEAQIALVECNQAEMGQVFMPYALMDDTTTVYQYYVEEQHKRLGAGGGA
jgi:hypothetical protein